jgi:hypothetical protein
MKTTKIKLKDWKSMKIVKPATASTATIRMDCNQHMFEYVFNTARNCYVREVFDYTNNPPVGQ